MVTGRHVLSNGREYFVTDTGNPYLDGEYPSGGFHIVRVVKDKRYYIDNSPDEETVSGFLRLAAKNAPE